MKLAIQTMRAIEQLMVSDQGVSFRKHLRETMPQAEDAYSESTDGFRTHLGASLIGRECPRALWYTFRWFVKPKHEARILRLFNRGHLEEGRFAALIKMLGCAFYQHDDAKKQFKFSAIGGHFGGSLDGVVVGLPDWPTDLAILSEFKTHGDKSFIKLQKEGVQSAKPEHHVQVQLYMNAWALPAAAYFGVNKNTDELHIEMLERKVEVAAEYTARAERIILLRQPPKRLGKDLTWYQCKYCEYSGICHSNAAPERNCRTCAHSCAALTGNAVWICEQLHCELSKEQQLATCDKYTRLP